METFDMKGAGMPYNNLFVSEGKYACYLEEAQRIFNKLDEKFKGYALTNDKCSEVTIPAMISEDVLQKCGYFNAFPGQICAVTRFNPDKYENVVNNDKKGCEYMTHDKQYLTPAACLHIYPLLKGCKVENRVFTTRARVYRYENDCYDDNTRMWDFAVREIVFVGCKEFVRQSLLEGQEYALDFARKICNKAVLEKANDPFYDNADNRIKMRLQNKINGKVELRIPVKNKELAVSSFNYHGFHFSEPFGFSNNRQIVTGCIGFGLDRWLASYLAYADGDNTLENILFS